MEKLLRTCDIENLYILIRSKKNDDIHTRIEKIFEDPVSLSHLLLEFLIVINYLLIFAAFRYSQKRQSEISK